MISDNNDPHKYTTPEGYRRGRFIDDGEMRRLFESNAYETGIIDASLMWLVICGSSIFITASIMSSRLTGICE